MKEQPTPFVLEARQITKHFPNGVVANAGLALQLRPGEFLALLGENGAGKSTLMNILYGLYQPDSGEILLNGQPVQLPNSQAAIAAGIGMVHQHFHLVPGMTVTENVILGAEVKHGLFFLDYKRATHQVMALAQQYGLEIDPAALVADLPVGAQQRVELLKVLYRQAKILILDEPTAVLTPQETKDLFRMLQNLKKQGTAIIFITHKLQEALQSADRIVVLRSGKVVGEVLPSETTEKELATLMVGRDVLLRIEKSSAKPGETVLDVRELQVFDDRQHLAIRQLALEVRAGEILGLAGVEGNGQTELVAALTGLRAIAGGSILLGGKEVAGASPRQISSLGVAHIPEDRQKVGLVLDYPLTDNTVLDLYFQKPFANGISRNKQAIEAHTQRLITDFDVRTPNMNVSARMLSGGNQQKLIIAREFTREIKLLIASQPTRGVDVGAIEFIHQQIIQKRAEGVAILLISAELDEILALADRIAVLFRGKIVATFEAAKVDREELGLLMAGGKNLH